MMSRQWKSRSVDREAILDVALNFPLLNSEANCK